jgi:hypothetical protein
MRTQNFEILNVNKFNSARKRMSVVCRTPEGKIMVYCKGADNIMIDRLAPDQRAVAMMKNALAHYGNEGLRTLVLAQRVLTEEQWAAWNKVYQAAATALSDREGALELAAEEIEQVCVCVWVGEGESAGKRAHRCVRVCTGECSLHLNARIFVRLCAREFVPLHLRCLCVSVCARGGGEVRIIQACVTETSDSRSDKSQSPAPLARHVGRGRPVVHMYRFWRRLTF